jgi:hypothetical protein
MKNKIMVLPDGTTWSMLEGCMVITLSDEELETLCMAGDFSNEVVIEEQRTLHPNDIDWEEVCYLFYHACGGMHSYGDLDWLQHLIEKYQSYFEDAEDLYE